MLNSPSNTNPYSDSLPPEANINISANSSIFDEDYSMVNRSYTLDQTDNNNDSNLINTTDPSSEEKDYPPINHPNLDIQRPPSLASITSNNSFNTSFSSLSSANTNFTTNNSSNISPIPLPAITIDSSVTQQTATIFPLPSVSSITPHPFISQYVSFDVLVFKTLKSFVVREAHCGEWINSFYRDILHHCPTCQLQILYPTIESLIKTLAAQLVHNEKISWKEVCERLMEYQSCLNNDATTAASSDIFNEFNLIKNECSRFSENSFFIHRFNCLRLILLFYAQNRLVHAEFYRFNLTTIQMAFQYSHTITVHALQSESHITISIPSRVAVFATKSKNGKADGGNCTISLQVFSEFSPAYHALFEHELSTRFECFWDLAPLPHTDLLPPPAVTINPSTGTVDLLFSIDQVKWKHIIYSEPKTKKTKKDSSSSENHQQSTPKPLNSFLFYIIAPNSRTRYEYRLVKQYLPTFISAEDPLITTFQTKLQNDNPSFAPSFFDSPSFSLPPSSTTSSNISSSSSGQKRHRERRDQTFTDLQLLNNYIKECIKLASLVSTSLRCRLELVQFYAQPILNKLNTQLKQLNSDYLTLKYSSLATQTNAIKSELDELILPDPAQVSTESFELSANKDYSNHFINCFKAWTATIANNYFQAIKDNQSLITIQAQVKTIVKCLEYYLHWLRHLVYHSDISLYLSKSSAARSESILFQHIQKTIEAGYTQQYSIDCNSRNIIEIYFPCQILHGNSENDDLFSKSVQASFAWTKSKAEDVKRFIPMEHLVYPLIYSIYHLIEQLITNTQSMDTSTSIILHVYFNESYSKLASTMSLLQPIRNNLASWLEENIQSLSSTFPSLDPTDYLGPYYHDLTQSEFSGTINHEILLFTFEGMPEPGTDRFKLPQIIQPVTKECSFEYHCNVSQLIISPKPPGFQPAKLEHDYVFYNEAITPLNNSAVDSIHLLRSNHEFAGIQASILLLAAAISKRSQRVIPPQPDKSIALNHFRYPNTEFGTQALLSIAALREIPKSVLEIISEYWNDPYILPYSMMQTMPICGTSCVYKRDICCYSSHKLSICPFNQFAIQSGHALAKQYNNTRYCFSAGLQSVHSDFTGLVVYPLSMINGQICVLMHGERTLMQSVRNGEIYIDKTVYGAFYGRRIAEEENSAVIATDCLLVETRNSLPFTYFELLDYFQYHSFGYYSASSSIAIYFKWIHPDDAQSCIDKFTAHNLTSYEALVEHEGNSQSCLNWIPLQNILQQHYELDPQQYSIKGNFPQRTKSAKELESVTIVQSARIPEFPTQFFEIPSVLSSDNSNKSFLSPDKGFENWLQYHNPYKDKISIASTLAQDEKKEVRPNIVNPTVTPIRQNLIEEEKKPIEWNLSPGEWNFINPNIRKFNLQQLNSIIQAKVSPLIEVRCVAIVEFETELISAAEQQFLLMTKASPDNYETVWDFPSSQPEPRSSGARQIDENSLKSGHKDLAQIISSSFNIALERVIQQLDEFLVPMAIQLEPHNSPSVNCFSFLYYLNLSQVFKDFQFQPSAATNHSTVKFVPVSDLKSSSRLHHIHYRAQEQFDQTMKFLRTTQV